MTKTAAFTNSVDPNEVAHYEPPHQDLHCLSSSLGILNLIQMDKTIIEIFAEANFGAERVNWICSKCVKGQLYIIVPVF